MIFRTSRRLASLSLLALAACSSAPTGGASDRTARVTEAKEATGARSTEATAAAPRTHDEWRKHVAKNHAPKRGCYRATEPSTAWEEVPCGPAPRAPHRVPEGLVPPAPAAGSRILPEVINGNNAFDVSVAGQGTLFSARGWFPFESGGTGESDNNGSANQTGANSYEAQLNTNTFFTPACNGQSGCVGWEQFIYGALEQQGYIEFSLVGYSGSCPAPFGSSYTTSSGQQVCYYNTDYTSPPSVAASNLTSLILSGETTNDALGDPTEYFDVIAGNQASELIENSELGLASFWTSAEFNVYGDAKNTQAVFGNATSLQVQVDTTVKGSESPAAPTSCSSAGQGTSESNNLFLNGGCCAFGGEAQGARFSESTSSTAASTFVCPTAPKCTYVYSCANGGQVTVSCTPDGDSPSSDPITVFQLTSNGNIQVASQAFQSQVTTPTQVATVPTSGGLATETLYGCAGSSWGGLVCDKPTALSTPSCSGQPCAGGGTWGANGQCNPPCVPGAPGCNAATLSAGNNPLQVVQGGSGSANLVLTGPWQAADQGAGATTVVETPNVIPGGTYQFANGGPIDGYGIIFMTVTTTASTPLGTYPVELLVTDHGSGTQVWTTVQVQVICLPEPPSSVCAAAFGGAACGIHAAGCNTTVDCGACAGGAACGANGYCPCVPAFTSCTSAQTCGSIVNNCGQSIKCGGTCGAGTSCSGNICCPSGEVNSNGVCCPSGETGGNGICCPSGESPYGTHCCPTGELWSASLSKCVSPVSGGGGGGCRCTKTACNCQ